MIAAFITPEGYSRPLWEVDGFFEETYRHRELRAEPDSDSSEDGEPHILYDSDSDFSDDFYIDSDSDFDDYHIEDEDINGTSGSARKQILFRVHKSVLASASKVFASMFELSGGADELDDVYEGAPLILMAETARDIKALMDMVYSPSSFISLYVLCFFFVG